MATTNLDVPVLKNCSATSKPTVLMLKTDMEIAVPAVPAPLAQCNQTHSESNDFG